MLVEQQLEAHADGFGGRIAIDGEDVMLKPEAVHNLGLALHELTANAEKYGSLSDSERRDPHPMEFLRGGRQAQAGLAGDRAARP